jgi:hypothetical protein
VLAEKRSEGDEPRRRRLPIAESIQGDERFGAASLDREFLVVYAGVFHGAAEARAVEAESLRRNRRHRAPLGIPASQDALVGARTPVQLLRVTVA